ncbi:MAG: hypothetical protein HY747_05205 [Elusimicrobia bacterium]|nr:hypothetical protein [Elusimicrobiota bacterium]
MTLLTSGGAKRRAPTPFAKFRGPAAMASGHISALGALRSRAVPQWGTPNQPAIRHIATVAREVYDVTGAGDTAVACFALCQTAGASPVEAAELSNLAAGIVVGKVGTATVARAELREALK